MSWILLIYKIPSAPARHRIGVWRRLKKLGAIYLQKSAVVLPDNTYLRDELENLAHDIENFRGEATIVFTSDIEKEAKIVAEFQEQSNKEYERIISRCKKFLKSIPMELKRTKIKELEVMLDESKQRFAEARRRDYFDARKSEETERIVTECEELYLKLVRGV